MSPTRSTQNMTLEEELAALNVIRDDDNNIVATPTDMTWAQVTGNTQTIAQIVEDAKPIGKLGSVAQYEAASYANEVAKSLLLLVSKHDFEGQSKTDARPNIPAGTDWLRKDVRTQAAVKSFFNEVVDLVALTRWQMSTGGKGKDFPFIKSVEYFFGKLRREVLPQETLVAYNLASTEPAERVTANAAQLSVAVKRAEKLLDGVKLYPKTFEDATSARDQINKIKAHCDRLLNNVTSAMNAATAANGEATGTNG